MVCGFVEDLSNVIERYQMKLIRFYYSSYFNVCACVWLQGGLRAVAEWQTEQVLAWFVSVELGHHSNAVMQAGLTGAQLLALDNNKIKVGTSTQFF